MCIHTQGAPSAAGLPLLDFEGCHVSTIFILFFLQFLHTGAAMDEVTYIHTYIYIYTYIFSVYTCPPSQGSSHHQDFPVRLVSLLGCVVWPIKAPALKVLLGFYHMDTWVGVFTSFFFTQPDGGRMLTVQYTVLTVVNKVSSVQFMFTTTSSSSSVQHQFITPFIQFLHTLSVCVCKALVRTEQRWTR